MARVQMRWSPKKQKTQSDISLYKNDYKKQKGTARHPHSKRYSQTPTFISYYKPNEAVTAPQLRKTVLFTRIGEPVI